MAPAKVSPSFKRAYTTVQVACRPSSPMSSDSIPTASSVWMPAASIMATLSQKRLIPALSSFGLAIVSPVRS
jgi:hypothetical protein